MAQARAGTYGIPGAGAVKQVTLMSGEIGLVKQLRPHIAESSGTPYSTSICIEPKLPKFEPRMYTTSPPRGLRREEEEEGKMMLEIKGWE